VSEKPLSELIESVKEIARGAGGKILEVYDKDITVEWKENDSPLTEADKRAHEYITLSLEQLQTGYPLLSEEGKEIDYDTRKVWHRYWLIDPLDGTKEFIKRNGEFTVNIALIENGVPVLGVVYAPVLDILYFASSESGAFKQTGDAQPQTIHVHRYQVGEVWHVVASRSHMSEETESLIESLGESELVSMGSSLKLCLVAEGRAHIYPRLAPTSEWDTAAAQCVVEQAGGKVVKPDMSPLLYNTKESLLNPHFIVCYDVDDIWANYFIHKDRD
jgi:3'(2'), 5'-bisphosphate nucleotidase